MHRRRKDCVKKGYGTSCSSISGVVYSSGGNSYCSTGNVGSYVMCQLDFSFLVSTASGSSCYYDEYYTQNMITTYAMCRLENYTVSDKDILDNF